MSSSAVLSPHPTDFPHLSQTTTPAPLRRNTRRSVGQRAGTASPLNVSTALSTSSTRSRKRAARTSDSGSNDAEQLSIDMDGGTASKTIKLMIGNSSPSNRSEPLTDLVRDVASSSNSGGSRKSISNEPDAFETSSHRARQRASRIAKRPGDSDRQNRSDLSSAEPSPPENAVPLPWSADGKLGKRKERDMEVESSALSDTGGLGLTGVVDNEAGPSQTSPKPSPDEEGEPELEEDIVMEEDSPKSTATAPLPLAAPKRRGGPPRKKRKGPIPGSLAIRRAAAAAAAAEAANNMVIPAVAEDAEEKEFVADGTGPGRAPRKKRKWLKRGEVDPDDPVAVARQRERHAMIDEAIENLDRQTRMVLDESHPQLLEMFAELDKRRDIQISRVEARFEYAEAELAKVKGVSQRVDREQWEYDKDVLQDTMSTENRHAMYRIMAEKQSLRRRPWLTSSLRDGRGGGGWTVYEGHLLSKGDEKISDVRMPDNSIRERRGVELNVGPADSAEINSDLLRMGIALKPRVKIEPPIHSKSRDSLHVPKVSQEYKTQPRYVVDKPSSPTSIPDRYGLAPSKSLSQTNPTRVTVPVVDLPAPVPDHFARSITGNSQPHVQPNNLSSRPPSPDRFRGLASGDKVDQIPIRLPTPVSQFGPQFKVPTPPITKAPTPPIIKENAPATKMADLISEPSISVSPASASVPPSLKSTASTRPAFPSYPTPVLPWHRSAGNSQVVSAVTANPPSPRATPSQATIPAIDHYRLYRGDSNKSAGITPLPTFLNPAPSTPTLAPAPRKVSPAPQPSSSPRLPTPTLSTSKPESPTTVAHLIGPGVGTQTGQGDRYDRWSMKPESILPPSKSTLTPIVPTSLPASAPASEKLMASAIAGSAQRDLPFRPGPFGRGLQSSRQTDGMDQPVSPTISESSSVGRKRKYDSAVVTDWLVKWKPEREQEAAQMAEQQRLRNEALQAPPKQPRTKKPKSEVDPDAPPAEKKTRIGHVRPLQNLSNFPSFKQKFIAATPAFPYLDPLLMINHRYLHSKDEVDNRKLEIERLKELRGRVPPDPATLTFFLPRSLTIREIKQTCDEMARNEIPQESNGLPADASGSESRNGIGPGLASGSANGTTLGAGTSTMAAGSHSSSISTTSKLNSLGAPTSTEAKNVTTVGSSLPPTSSVPSSSSSSILVKPLSSSLLSSTPAPNAAPASTTTTNPAPKPAENVIRQTPLHNRHLFLPMGGWY